VVAEPARDFEPAHAVLTHVAKSHRWPGGGAIRHGDVTRKNRSGKLQGRLWRALRDSANDVRALSSLTGPASSRGLCCDETPPVGAVGRLSMQRAVG
jgi:hypothetical protein